MAGRVDRDDLGAWLVRCNPRLSDLDRLWAEKGGPLDSWCVGTNYRSALMRPGDRILLWVGGQSPRYERGIWGDGSVVGEPIDVEAESGGRPKLVCPVEITPLLDVAVTDQQLRAAGISDLEIQRAPQGISPSWVTKSQLAGIVQLMAQQRA